MWCINGGQRQTRKNTHRTCSFSCTTDEREKLQGCAKTHGLSVSQYVKQASLTYGSGGSIPMRNDGINHLLEHVIDVKNFVHRIRTFSYRGTWGVTQITG